IRTNSRATRVTTSCLNSPENQPPSLLPGEADVRSFTAKSLRWMMALRFQACREAAGASAQDVIDTGHHPQLLGFGGVLVHILDTEIPLTGAADAANFGAGVPGELVGGGPGLAGGFSDHLRLDGVELGEEELRLVFIALGQRHTGFYQLTDALHAFLDPLDIPGAHQHCHFGAIALGR